MKIIEHLFNVRIYSLASNFIFQIFECIKYLYLCICMDKVITYIAELELFFLFSSFESLFQKHNCNSILESKYTIDIKLVISKINQLCNPRYIYNFG